MSVLKELLGATPDEVEDAIDFAYNNEKGTLSGRMDAIAHFGQLMTGKYTTVALAAIQGDILFDPETDEDYTIGYCGTWKTLYNMARGVVMDEISR